VKPETIIGWHRAGFRLYWRWRSGQGAADPTSPCSDPAWPTLHEIGQLPLLILGRCDDIFARPEGLVKWASRPLATSRGPKIHLGENTGGFPLACWALCRRYEAISGRCNVLLRLAQGRVLSSPDRLATLLNSIQIEFFDYTTLGLLRRAAGPKMLCKMWSSTFLDASGRPSFNALQNYGSSTGPL
jgi:hypothetical protein